MSHLLEKQKVRNAAAEANLKKSEFNFIVDLKILFQKSSVDPKKFQLTTSLRNNQKEGPPGDFTAVFIELTEHFGLLLAVGKIVIPEHLKKQVVKALHFGHTGSTKMQSETNIFWWSRMKKDIKYKCSTYTACISSVENLNT